MTATARSPILPVPHVATETKRLLVFLALTFVWTWAFYAPIAIGHHSPYQMPWQVLLIFGGMGPSVMGVAMILFTAGPEQRRLALEVRRLERVVGLEALHAEPRDLDLLGAVALADQAQVRLRREELGRDLGAL